MDITCGRCRRSYFVPDDLAQARTFRAKCSGCGHAFSVEVPARARGKKKDAPPPDDLRATSASAIPDLAADLADTDLGWLEDAAKEADAAAADEIVLLTVRRSRRGSALALAAGVAVVAAAVAGIAIWMTVRAKLPDAPARTRTRTFAEGGGAPVQDVGGLAWRAEPEPPPQAPEPAPGPLPLQRKRPRLAQDDRRLLDLLARKQDVAVIPLEEDAGAESEKSTLDPAAAGKVMASNRKAFDACISRSLRLNPSLKLVRRTTLVVTIQPSGTVAKAYLAEEEVDRTDLGACLTDTARRMVFPAFEGEPVDVAMPLSLSAVF